MQQAVKSRPPTPVATKIGLVLWGLSFIWWFAYYANYGGAFGLLGHKLMCIDGATRECLAFQKDIGRAAVPTYYPILWYAGLLALVIGAYQTWSARRAT